MRRKINNTFNNKKIVGTSLIGFLILTTIALSGCGVSDAVKATREMPDRMDQMDRQIAETNKKMETMIEQVKQTNSNTETLLGKVRRQLLLIAREDTMSPKHYSFKPAVGIVSGAKAFAEAAENDELLGFIKLGFAHLRAEKTGAEGPRDSDADGKEVKKIHFLNAMRAVAGYVPQQKVLEIVEKEIIQRGENQYVAYAFLMLRAEYLREMILNAQYLESENGLKNIKSFQAAIRVLEDYEYILNFTPGYRDKVAYNARLEDKTRIDAKLPPREDGHKFWLALQDRLNDPEFSNGLDEVDRGTPAEAALKKIVTDNVNNFVPTVVIAPSVDS